IELEKARTRGRELEVERPARVGQAGATAPAAEAVVEILAADEAIRQIEAAGGGDFLDREHMLVDRPDMRDLGVDPGRSPAVEIGVLAKPTRHRLVGQVAASEAERQPTIVERE